MRTTGPGSSEPGSRHRPGRGMRVLAAVIFVSLLLLGLYTWIVLWWSYSEGERTGVVQKISRKGFLCKTWEGEMAMTTVPGVAPVMWQFTVRDGAAVGKVRETLGKRVVLHYTEHVGVPSSCFGDTPYYVDDVRTVE